MNQRVSSLQGRIESLLEDAFDLHADLDCEDQRRSVRAAAQKLAEASQILLQGGDEDCVR